MPITHGPGSTTFTGDSIAFFRLCSLKAAVGLELHGIKLRRGRVIWKQVKAEFAIPGSKGMVYTWLCEEVERQRALQPHIDETGADR